MWKSKQDVNGWGSGQRASILRKTAFAFKELTV